jgi:hypothetical protein
VGRQTDWSAQSSGQWQWEEGPNRSEITPAVAQRGWVPRADSSWVTQLQQSDDDLALRRPGSAAQARAERARAATPIRSLLARILLGVVVPVRARDLVIKTSAGDVHVINRRRLRRWLRRRPDVLDAGTVDAIFDKARRPTTWLS